MRSEAKDILHTYLILDGSHMPHKRSNAFKIKEMLDTYRVLDANSM
jgi:hypothetical protein